MGSRTEWRRWTAANHFDHSHSHGTNLKDNIRAHRVTTMRDRNRIFVFEHDRIDEVGSYSELVAGDDQFAALVKSASSAGSRG